MNAKTTQTQNPTQIPYDAWKKLVDDQLGRIQTFNDEMARYEKQAVEQTTQAVDELAKLMKESLDYAGQLTTEWRKVAIDATHKASEMFNQALSN